MDQKIVPGASLIGTSYSNSVSDVLWDQTRLKECFLAGSGRQINTNAPEVLVQVCDSRRVWPSGEALFVIRYCRTGLYAGFSADCKKLFESANKREPGDRLLEPFKPHPSFCTS